MTDTPTPDGPPIVADLIPRRFRRGVYAVLSAAYGLEIIFDFLPAGLESKLVAAATFLGFGMAFVHAGPARTTTPTQEG